MFSLGLVKAPVGILSFQNLLAALASEVHAIEAKVKVTTAIRLVFIKEITGR
jgi:hypothetical protein